MAALSVTSTHSKMLKLTSSIFLLMDLTGISVFKQSQITSYQFNQDGSMLEFGSKFGNRVKAINTHAHSHTRMHPYTYCTYK